uniref:DUF4806 domain-containing protein n=2 Tax=Photinus pyralis TaxID=7054 RepID=A0A1Y1LZX5_PHOPY
MNSKTWTVVQFLDDLTVEAIPSTWIQGNECHWPSFSMEKLHNAIRKSEPLNTCWPTHKIKIFRNATYGDYLKARNKARIAENTSDINTEPEDVEVKRKRIQKILSSSEESIDDTILPPPPSISKYKAKKKTSTSTSTFKEVHITPGNDLGNGVHEATDNSFFENIENMHDDINDNYLEAENNNTCKNCRCKDCLEKDRALDRTNKQLMQQYHILRSMATDILGEVRSIKQSLSKAERTPDEAPTSFFTELGCQFPLNSEEEIKIFNTSLEDEDNFKNAVMELSRVGGSNTYSFVSRTLALLITNELAITYSWLGRKGKKVFKTLKVASLVIGGYYYIIYS